MLSLDIKPVKWREPFDGWTLDIASDANKNIKNRSLAKRAAAWDTDRQLPALEMCIQSACVGGIAAECALCTIPI